MQSGRFTLPSSALPATESAREICPFTPRRSLDSSMTHSSEFSVPRSPARSRLLSIAPPSLDFRSESVCGPARKENQDAGIAWQGDDGAVALIVSDGMGGHAAGREAAEIVIRTCSDSVRGRNAATLWKEALATALYAAHAAVLTAQASPEHQGMGATAALALLVPGDSAFYLHLAHVGDSRVYLQRGRSLFRLTTDHSLVAQMVSDGMIREDEAFGHPDSNVLHRAIGQQASFEPDTQEPILLEAGDLVLVCSDGLHGSVPDETICRIIAASGGAEATCRNLLAAAIELGSLDDITASCCRLPALRGRRRRTRVP